MLTPLVDMILLRPYVFGFLIAFLILSIRLWGGWRTGVWLVLGYLIAWASEAISIRWGFPYGLYLYKYENLSRDILVAGVPLWDSLSYTFLIFAGYSLALYRFPTLPRAWLAVAGGFFTMLLDVMIDPVANLGRYWFLGDIYYYPNGGAHFGVPLSNYIGWFFVSWLVIVVFQQITRWNERVLPNGGLPLPHTCGMGTHSAAGPVRSILYPAFYFSIGLFNTAIAFWIGAWGIGLSNSILLGILLTDEILYSRCRRMK